jgi:hypothetical protein
MPMRIIASSFLGFPVVKNTFVIELKDTYVVSGVGVIINPAKK